VSGFEPEQELRQDPRIIVALDFSSEASARNLVDRLDPKRCRLKVGKELFTRLGPGFIERLGLEGFEVFLDLKFHDIPNTVAAACDAAADLGVWMINLHASGGQRMMAAARERMSLRSCPPLLIAVTVLTSLDAADLEAIGCPGQPQQRVLRLARLAREAGVDGVVCSPREAGLVRGSLGADFQLVTPGVRPAGAVADDQKRVTTPAEAVSAGADYLVIGRPISAAPDPLDALTRIEQEIWRAAGG
jgi:orotidine-5'-phosphate decarboxylase